ncbi:MAG: protease inhibitor I42 family protein [Candidatus Omnitrophota bacterium]|nr:protease inhibitor I42 family protein [Candidatus Omnitrophota bacterium]
MMSRAILSFILISAIAVSFCADAQGATKKPVKITENDKDSTVEMRVGELLEVTLIGNPSTGYMWDVASVNPNILKPIEQLEFQGDSKAIGAPGKLTLRFEATRAGKTPLKLIYHRPWEKNVEPIDTFEVTVVIKDK